MRSALLLLPLLLLWPLACQAQEPALSLVLDAPSNLVNLGQGTTALLTLTEGGAPVANARLLVTQGGSTSERVTNGTGQVSLGLYHGRDPGSVAVSARAVAQLEGNQWRPVSSNEVATTFHWTEILLALTGPSAQVPATEPAAVVAKATWRHDGTPVAGVRFHFAGNQTSQHRFADANGAATMQFTRSTPGTLNIFLGIDTPDLPSGIWTASNPSVVLQFGPPPTAPTPTTTSPAGGGGDPGGTDGPGGPGNPDSPGATSPAASAPPAGNPCPGAVGTDLDGDGTDDACDTDRDNDTVHDSDDAFPEDPGESSDADGDGRGDGDDEATPSPTPSPDAQKRASYAGLGATILILAAAGRIQRRNGT